eukprot:Skav201341  [mRNA]  locus=scaffold1389:342359:347181:+ [translate_table: standard]
MISSGCFSCEDGSYSETLVDFDVAAERAAFPPKDDELLSQMATGPMTPIEATQVGLVWRMARRIMAAQSGTDEAQFIDVDPWVESEGGSTATSEPAAPARAQSSGVKERVLKMASLIDQSDESELLPPQAQDIDKWFQNFIVLMGSQPDEAEEPTSSQLGALSKKVFEENRPPYTDFSVWTPFERRMARVQKCRVFRPLGDGSYLQQDLPGPSTFMAWKASWNVFRTAAIMLNIASLASLEAYFKQVEKMTVQWPSCWGLIYMADDAARAERMEKIRRRITIDSSNGRQVPRDWDPMRPWSCVFFQLAGDVDYWTEKVHHPAAAWVASGQRGSPVVATEAAVLGSLHGGQMAMKGDKAAHPEDVPQSSSARTQFNRERRLARKRRQVADREELVKLKAKVSQPDSFGGHGGKGAGKGKSKGKSKDQAGTELCFSWDSGKGPCADVPPGGKCKGSVERAHKCRLCLSPLHRSDQCPNK